MSDYIVNIQGVDLSANLSGTITANEITTTKRAKGRDIWKVEDGTCRVVVDNVTLRELLTVCAPGLVVVAQRDWKKGDKVSAFTFKVREYLDRERQAPTIVGRAALVSQIQQLHEAGVDEDTIANVMVPILKDRDVAIALVSAVIEELEAE